MPRAGGDDALPAARHRRIRRIGRGKLNKNTATGLPVAVFLCFLFVQELAEAHEDRGDLGAGGVRLRAQLAVRALNQALADGPLHRGDGPRTDVGSVRKLGQILRERNRFEAVLDRIAEQHCDELFARDRAGHIRAVGDFVLHRPALTSGVPRRASGALAVQTRQNGHDHAARGIRVRGELVLARAVHEALVDHIVDGRSVPYVAGNVCKSGLTSVGVERILRGFARRNDRDRRVFAAHLAGRARGVRFAARSLADLADTEMVAAAFSCGKEDFMSREPFEAMPDVMDAKQLAEALQISKAGAYNLLSSPDFPTLRIGGRKLVMKK